MNPSAATRGIAMSGLLVACSPESPPGPAPDPAQRELEVRREVLHQTREVIRYTEETQRLQQQEMQARGLAQ